MAFSNLSKNCTSTIKSRPPLVVFTVCLLGIIITTFSLAFYVHGYDKIANTDSRADWLSLVEHLNKLDICIESSNKSFVQMQDKGETVTVALLAKLSVPDLKQSLSAQGIIPLDGWTSRCPDRTKVPEYISVQFNFQPNETNSEFVCVVLEGPVDFMPKLSRQELCNPIPSRSEKVKMLSVRSVDVKDSQAFCRKGLKSKLLYSTDYNKNLKFDMFLSLEDRLTITSHLIVTSCFLVFIVILISCYALFSKKNVSNSGGDNKQLLMTKGIHI